VAAASPIAGARAARETVARLLEPTLRPDPARTVLKPFGLADERDGAGRDDGRLRRLAAWVRDLDDEAVEAAIAPIADRLADRHRGFGRTLRRNAAEAARQAPAARGFAGARCDLFGAYVTQEYSFEAAALFNPSAMVHPDQDGVPEGALRVALALRGIGEGHVSSVTLRNLVWHGDERLELEEASPFAVSPEVEHCDGGVRLTCPDSETASETVLYPVLPSQSRGLEDLRSVRLVEEDGRERYLGTYTAVGDDGAALHLVEGFDFRTFDIWPAEGSVARDKGGALFPRRVGGEYLMVTRPDGRSLALAHSNDLVQWRAGAPILAGEAAWEAALIGNCGSPIEIDGGWLLLTHGVGPMRGYSIGACLLDRDDPSRVLARLCEPLVTPDMVERAGYVPNIVYSCGSVVLGERLLLPLGVADTYTAFALVDLPALLRAMS